MVMSEQHTGESFVTRRIMPAVGMTAAALILLTACGGDNSSGKIEATQTATVAASASSTLSATPAVQRPVITFPADAKNVFEDQHTGDPTKDAVLADNARMEDSIYAAIIQGNAHTSAMAFYSKDLALGSAADFVQGWVDGDTTWTGTIRLVRPEGHAQQRRIGRCHLLLRRE